MQKLGRIVVAGLVMVVGAALVTPAGAERERSAGAPPRVATNVVERVRAALDGGPNVPGPIVGTGLRAARAAGTLAGSDAYGDVDHEGLPTNSGDIRTYAIYYNTNRISLALKTWSNWDPATEPYFLVGDAAYAWPIEVTGDDVEDFVAIGAIADDGVSLQGGVFSASSGALLCDASFVWSDAGGAVLTFPPSCLGGLGGIRTFAVTLVDVDWRPDVEIWSRDWAPDDSYTDWVDPVTAPRPVRAVAASGYLVDGFGGIHRWATASTALPALPGPADYWPGWDIARDVAHNAARGRGVVVDGWGGLHGFATTGTRARTTEGPYWPGWDIARGVALMPDGRSGLVVDGFGGLHSFLLGSGGTKPVVSGTPYWRGWDIAVGVTILPDGTGGYIADGWGGLHPFRINGGPTPPAATKVMAWPGRYVARGVSVLADVSGGYTVDGAGRMWGFNLGTITSGRVPQTPAGPRFPFDIARGITGL